MLSDIITENGLDLGIATTGNDSIIMSQLPPDQLAYFSASPFPDAIALLQGDDNLLNDNTGRIFYGNQGSDTILGGGGNDTLFGGQDDDFLEAGGGNSILFGNFGNDTLIGGPGNDSLYGGAGNDVVIGGSGNSIVSGDKGLDTLTGSGSANQFILASSGADQDVITDFQAGIDKMRLPNGISFNNLQILSDGSSVSTRIELNGETLVILENVSPSSITNNDFIETEPAIEIEPPTPSLPPDLPSLLDFPLPATSPTVSTQSNGLSAELSNSSQALPDVNEVLTTGLNDAIAQLQDILVAPDFDSKIVKAFGESADVEAARFLIQQLSNGQSLPTFKIISIDEIAGNLGAFDKLTNTVYISQDFLSQNANNPENIANVLLEEIGHSIDSQINATDAPGDEGAIFSELVRGNTLSDEELSTLKNKDDIATLTVDNSSISVELSQQSNLWNLWVYEVNPSGQTDFLYDARVPSEKSEENGIYLNWGFDSADRYDNIYFGDRRDDFMAIAGKYFMFDAGTNYTFQGNADDAFLLAAQNYETGDNTWITPEWDFDGGVYTFTPEQSGWYAVYTFFYENEGNAYLDVSWEAEDTSQDGPWTEIAYKDGETIDITLEAIDGQPITDKPTWIVIHGNQSNADNMSHLANAIKSNDPNSQVLTLDWEDGARDGFLVNSHWMQPVAQAARNVLKDLGISNDNINLAGHSLGAYISYYIAESTPGGINNMIALDPATQIPAGERTSDIDFSDYSNWSWGFYGSSSGSNVKAATADEYFQMFFHKNDGILSYLNPINWVTDNFYDNHGYVHQGFADILNQNNESYHELWSLDEMQYSDDKQWYIDDGSLPEAQIFLRKNGAGKWQVDDWESYVKIAY